MLANTERVKCNLKKIDANNFMEKDHDGQSHWIPLDTSMMIQGLLAERKDGQRVYVVTINSAPEFHWIHDHWPKLVRLDQRKIAANDKI